MTTIVFVGGAGRSGTTFLAHVLSRFNNISAGVESQWVYELISSGLDPSKWVDFARNHWKVRTSPRRLDSAEWKELEDIASRSRIDIFCSKLLRLLAEDDVDFIVDHTPSNMIRHTSLRKVFPNAKFIHIVRDGRAVYASLKRVKWGPSSPYAAADYWLHSIAHGLLAEQTMEPSVFRRVHYEILVQKPEVLNELAEWITGTSATLENISKNDNKNFSSIKELPRYTREQHTLVNKPPDPTRIDAWKKGLSCREVAAFEQRTDAFLKYFNYSVQYYPHLLPGRLYQAGSQLKETVMRLLVNPIRNAIRTRGAQYH